LQRLISGLNLAAKALQITTSGHAAGLRRLCIQHLIALHTQEVAASRPAVHLDSMMRPLAAGRR
jgi:hypothetical protein